jgi:hypothetical protein
LINFCASQALFIDSYVKRTDMNIARTPSGTPQAGELFIQPSFVGFHSNFHRFLSAPTLKTPVLNITGSLSPHIDDTVTFNGRLEPTKCNWMKVCSILLATLTLCHHFVPF